MISKNNIVKFFRKFIKDRKKNIKKFYKNFVLINKLRKKSIIYSKSNDVTKYQPINLISNEDILDAWQKNYKPLLNPISFYHYLIENLVKIDDIKILPLYDLFSLRSENYKAIGLRHDIDANPVNAIRLARILAQNGVCGSFYLLHTALYYGQFYKDIFVRNQKLIPWIKEFIITGCELGLHNDAYGVYSNYNCNGIESVKQEIEWLRSVGAIIRGSVAHNSAVTYGAENYEIFKENVLWQREVLIHKKIRLPIGKISNMELNLDYEGTFALPKSKLNIMEAKKFLDDKKSANIRSKKWMHLYLKDNPYCDWATDYQFWLIGQNIWVAAGGINDYSLFEWNIDLMRVLQIIRELPNNTRSVIVIHPEYFSLY